MWRIFYPQIIARKLMPNLCGKLVKLKKNRKEESYFIFCECDFPKMSKTFKSNNLDKSVFYVIELMQRKDLLYGVYKILYSNKILYFNEYHENCFEEIKNNEISKNKR